MSDHQTYQVHLNGNADHGDLGLRVTITFYDETGHMTATQTWRKHVRDLSFEGSDWQALSVAVELAKMMGEVSAAGLELDSLQPPLF